MSFVIWATNPSRPNDGRLKVEWDGADAISVTSQGGSVEVWSVERDRPQIEELGEQIAIRCNMKRLIAEDSFAPALLRWRGDLGKPRLPTSAEAPPNDETLSRYALLLSEGKLTLDEFQRLVAGATAQVNDTNKTTEDPKLQEFIRLIAKAWPGQISSSTDILGKVTLSGAPDRVDSQFLRRLLQLDQNEFQTHISSSSGLVSAYLKYGDGINFPGMPKSFVGGYMQGASGMPILTKLFQKELRHGNLSSETRTLISRTRQAIQSRQTPLRWFAKDMGWYDLPFLD